MYYLPDPVRCRGCGGARDFPGPRAYDCVRSGELPSISLGRRVVIPRRALDHLLACRPASNHV